MKSTFIHTIHSLRGLHLYGSRFRKRKALDAAKEASEIFLSRRLYKRKSTGAVIKKEFINIALPAVLALRLPLRSEGDDGNRPRSRSPMRGCSRSPRESAASGRWLGCGASVLQRVEAHQATRRLCGLGVNQHVAHEPLDHRRCAVGIFPAPAVGIRDRAIDGRSFNARMLAVRTRRSRRRPSGRGTDGLPGPTTAIGDFTTKARSPRNVTKTNGHNLRVFATSWFRLNRARPEVHSESNREDSLEPFASRAHRPVPA